MIALEEFIGMSDAQARAALLEAWNRLPDTYSKYRALYLVFILTEGGNL